MRRHYVPLLALAMLSSVLLGMREGPVAGHRSLLRAPEMVPEVVPLSGAIVPTVFDERVEITVLRWRLSVGPAAPGAVPAIGHQLFTVEEGTVDAPSTGERIPSL
jgi:hypothetical protein